MNIRKSLVMALMLIGALVLVACGGGAQDAGSGDGGDSGTTGGTELSQTITTDDGITVNYPEGWVAQGEFGSVILASSQELLDMMNSGEQPESIEAGQILVVISALPGAGVLPEGTSLASFAEGFASEGIDGEVTETEINGKEAVTITGVSSDETLSAGGHVVIINDADAETLILAAATTAAGEEGNIAATVNAIAGSVTLAPSEG